MVFALGTGDLAAGVGEQKKSPNGLKDKQALRLRSALCATPLFTGSHLSARLL